ncbi:hypothetical protein [Vulcanibacillus modesticaldus]|uniref:hypothetical protein n=1 Tax=Vulcanibacillus modesticaldus TaxID=337097 RepID=UPI00159F2DC3|nr:hypothetical protein [Vulcanibacillus modesticaldus]
MKQLIVTIALIILGVYISNVLILDENTGNSLKNAGKVIADQMINDVNLVQGNSQ